MIKNLTLKYVCLLKIKKLFWKSDVSYIYPINILEKIQ